MPETNKRYNIDRRLVAKQVKKKVAHYEAQRLTSKNEARKNREAYAENPKGFHHPPPSDEDIDAMYNEWIKREREHYAKVRVIRLAGNAKPQYVLVYGDQADAEVTSGTGPFDKLAKARDWFLKSGR
jgi:hypothetical protein